MHTHNVTLMMFAKIDRHRSSSHCDLTIHSSRRFQRGLIQALDGSWLHHYYNRAIFYFLHCGQLSINEVAY